jgi:hypothetical protein
VKRHDLFSVLYNSTIGAGSDSTVDLLKIQVPLNADIMGKYCFALCRAQGGGVSKLKAACADVDMYTTAIKYNKLPKELVLLTDCEEIAGEILSERLTKHLVALKKYIRVIHITNDSKADPLHPCMLSCEFKLSQASSEDEKMEEKKIIRLAIHLIEVAARASEWLAKHPQVSHKVEQRRTDRSKSTRTHQRQMDKARQRKDDKAAKEKEKMERMAPEELRKYEIKKYNKELKKRNHGGGKGKTKAYMTSFPLLLDQGIHDIIPPPPRPRHT